MQYETVIGILTYKRYDLFEICAESVLATTDFSKSVLLIVNNSIDEEYIAKINDFARKHSLPVINFRENRGTSAAWNAIARIYDCKQISILNDDLRLHPRWQEAMDCVLQQHKGIAAVSLQHGNGVDHWNNFTNTVPHEKLNVPNDIIVGNVIYPTGSHLMMRKEVFDDVGGFDENLWIGLEEVDFSFRAIAKGYFNGVIHNKLNYIFSDHYGSGTTYSAFAKGNIFEYFKNKYGFAWPLSKDIIKKMEDQSQENQNKWNT